MDSHTFILLIAVLLSGVYFAKSAEIRAPLHPVRTARAVWPWNHKEKQKDIVVFRLYTRDSEVNGPEVCTSDEEIPFKGFHLNKPVIIIIHGWKGYFDCHFTSSVLNGYLPKFDYNVITVDWSDYGSQSTYYPNARNKVPAVAEHVAKFLEELHDKYGVNLEDIHIIGHSLGAHVAGIAGQLVTSGKIGRITGMDPALPLFSLADSAGRLSTDSAKFVDVIHTSPNFVGFGRPIGHIDFFPNGPHMLQPGCGLDAFGRCSHRRSYLMYVESLSSPAGFLAVPCYDWEHFLMKQCDIDAVVPMGEYTPTTARGVYYLQTNSESPFGTGVLWQT